MDNETTIQELKELIQTFCEVRDWDQFHNPKELSIGLITEAAELLEHFRFKTPEQMIQLQNDEKKMQEVKEELADCLFFILRFAQMNNIDLTTEAYKKMEKNNTKYPVEKVKGLNKKYNEY